MEHTPTPWFVSDLGSGTVYYRESSGGEPPICRTTDIKMETLSKEESIANAEFIVRAVNAHEALLEACKNLLEITEGGGEPSGVIKAARAAIKLAEGE